MRPFNPSRPPRHRYALGALALLTVWTLSACGSSSATSDAGAATAGGSTSGGSAKTVRLGFSPLSLDIPGLQDTANALKGAGQSAGISVTVADPKFNVQTQVSQVQQWIQLHQVDAIWVIPIAPAAMAPVIKEAQAAKIPILVDTQPSKVGYSGAQPGVSFASTDYEKMGQDLGNMLVQCINERIGSSAQIIYMKDPSGQTSSDATDQAVAKALAASPGSKIVRSLNAPSQIVAQQSVLSALQAAPKAVAAIGTNDEAALGAAAAFQQAGKDPKKSCIVGGGGAAQALAAIKDGTIYGGVIFDFKTDTMNNIAAIMAMRADPTAVGQVLAVPITIVRAP